MDCLSKIHLYDFFFCIAYYGRAGGGHYIAYALNNLNQQWYEYDDENIRQVDITTTIQNAEVEKESPPSQPNLTHILLNENSYLWNELNRLKNQQDRLQDRNDRLRDQQDRLQDQNDRLEDLVSHVEQELQELKQTIFTVQAAAENRPPPLSPRPLRRLRQSQM
ncbi:unnamed protein product [Rotaria sp. Silwood2]|nr:unnamed protein product [Rotaria sp. Silwood2]CAF4330215.1 unnamed protein product [Rotaria sp. Silwood2]